MHLLIKRSKIIKYERITKKIESELRRPNAGANALCNVVADVAGEIVSATGLDAVDFIPRILYVNSDGEKVMTHEISFEMTPIAIEVVPGSHMEDGKSRWMSLKNMSLIDPESGTTATGDDPESNPGAGIRWGNAKSLVGDTEWNQIPVVVNGEENDDLLLGEEFFVDPYYYAGYGYLPICTDSIGIPYSYSINYKYLSASDMYVAPPFNADGTANPAYRATEVNGESINNPLSRFDGKEMTDLIIAAATETETEGAITNSSDAGHYPAAMCCHRYVTEGTNAGDWYLPAAGELGYAIVNSVIINDMINKLSDAGHDVVMIPIKTESNYTGEDGLGGNLWSSSEYSSSSAYFVDYDGSVFYSGKTNDVPNRRVRAFLAY